MGFMLNEEKSHYNSDRNGYETKDDILIRINRVDRAIMKKHILDIKKVFYLLKSNLQINI